MASVRERDCFEQAAVELEPTLRVQSNESVPVQQRRSVPAGGGYEWKKSDDKRRQYVMSHVNRDMHPVLNLGTGERKS